MYNFDVQCLLKKLSLGSTLNKWTFPQKVVLTMTRLWKRLLLPVLPIQMPPATNIRCGRQGCEKWRAPAGETARLGDWRCEGAGRLRHRHHTGSSEPANPPVGLAWSFPWRPPAVWQMRPAWQRSFKKTTTMSSQSSEILGRPLLYT